MLASAHVRTVVVARAVHARRRCRASPCHAWKRHQHDASTTRTGADTPAPATEPAPPLGARVGVLACRGLRCARPVLYRADRHTARRPVRDGLRRCWSPPRRWAPVLWPHADGHPGAPAALVHAAGDHAGPVPGEPRRAWTRPSVVDLAATFGGFLGRLLISVLLAQLFVTDKMRDLRVALSLAVGMFVLALANEPGSLVVVALLVGWPAVVTALAFDHAVGDQSKADTVAGHAATSARQRRLGVGVGVGSLPCLGLVAVLIVLLVPHPSGVGPHRRGGLAGGGAPVSSTGAPSRNAETYTSGTLDMRTRGELPDTEVAEVPVGQSRAVARRGARLLRRRQLARAGRQHVRHATGRWSALRPARRRTRRVGTGAERRDVVRRRVGFTGVLLAPGQPTAVDVAGQVLRLSGGFFVSAASGQEYPEGYTVTSQATDLPRSQLAQTPVGMRRSRRAGLRPAAAEHRPRARARARAAHHPVGHRTGTPRHVPSSPICASTRPTGSTRPFRRPVPMPLTTSCSWRTPASASSSRPLRWCCCGQQACRPAWQPASPVASPSGDHRTLRGSDAHAWVEVWYPDLGWAASDPTAGSRRADVGLTDRISSWLQRRRGAAHRRGLPCWRRLPWWRCRVVAASPGPPGSRRDGVTGGPRSSAATGAGGLRPAATRARRRGHAASAGRECRRAGRDGRRCCEAAGALAVVERTSYGARAPVGREADDAERTLNALAHQLRADFSAAER